MMRSLRMMMMATVPFLVLAACEPAAQEEQVPAVEEMPPTEEMPQAAPMAPAPMTPDTMMQPMDTMTQPTDTMMPGDTVRGRY
jgi:hypothetical protein